MLCVFMLIVFYAECHNYALHVVCCYDECRNPERLCAEMPKTG
jgi:hypothetical protein